MVEEPKEIDVEIEDVGSGGLTKNKKSFKSITMDQYHKCCIEGSKEMTLGGVTTRFIDGEEISYAVPNQVEIFINSVDMLNNLLTAKVGQNHKFIGGKMKTYYGGMEKIKKLLKKSLENLKKEYKKTSVIIYPEGYSERQGLDPFFKKQKNIIYRRYSS